MRRRNMKADLLILSQNTIRLLEGARQHISEVELPEVVPRSLAQTLADKGAEDAQIAKTERIHGALRL
jgi:hypothetical protein